MLLVNSGSFPSSNIHYPHGDLQCPTVCRYWSDRPDDLLILVQNEQVCLNVHSVMRKDGFRQRFFGRFNHHDTTVAQTWFQMPEYILRKYLKPACVRDLYELAVPHEAIAVNETGSSSPDSALKSCLRDCIRAVVPLDDVEVHAELLKWLPPKNLKEGLLPVFGLSAISKRYNYRISKISKQKMEEDIWVANKTGAKHEDIIIRPVTDSGHRVSILLHPSLSVTALPFLFIGWEFHAYLVRKTGPVQSIFEPTDEVLLDWVRGVHGIRFVKEAYGIHYARKK